MEQINTGLFAKSGDIQSAASQILLVAVIYAIGFGLPLVSRLLHL